MSTWLTAVIYLVLGVCVGLGIYDGVRANARRRFRARHKHDYVALLWDLQMDFHDPKRSRYRALIERLWWER